MPNHEGQAAGHVGGQSTGGMVVARSRPRRLGPEEAELVAELERKCFPSPWSAAQIRKGLEQGSIRIVGITESGMLLGYLSYFSVGDEAEVINFAVVPGRRRQGIGRAILRHVLQNWREEGIANGFLEVRASNEAAIGLYSSFGFFKAGVRKGYYPETGEDALLLKLILTDPPGPRERS